MANRDKLELIVRAIKDDDLDSLVELFRQVNSGRTPFKADRRALSKRLEIVRASFAEQIPPVQCDYLFVMEDSRSGRLAGVCDIKGAVGLEEPCYSYRVGTLVHSSRELKVYTRMETLSLSNDLTGSTALCSLLLHPDYRGGTQLLSQSRFLFVAQFSHLFSERLIAEMRGYQRMDGSSPFYDALGRHFFKMEFKEADAVTGFGRKSFIAELMPRQPMYTAYFPAEAQAVIGKVRVGNAPARRALEQEGMYFEGYIDIFDAGPVLQARVSNLRAARDSLSAVVGPGKTDAAALEIECEPMLVSNTVLKDFRLIVAKAQPNRGLIALSDEEKRVLGCHAGQTVRTLSMNPRKNAHV